MPPGRLWLTLWILAGSLNGQTPRVTAAVAFIERTAAKIHSDKIRNATLDALKPETCIAHRAGLTDSQKSEILANLRTEGLLDPGANLAGVLSARSRRWLGMSEASATLRLRSRKQFRRTSFLSRRVSHPRIVQLEQQPEPHEQDTGPKYGPDLTIEEDLLIAAPIWHDWAKTIVFQWKPDGTETGRVNHRRDCAHHILSLAETMKRGLPPDLIVVQASAHAAPVLGNESKVVNWIRAAAMIAQVDPVAQGYLSPKRSGNAHSEVSHRGLDPNLSDADFVVSIPAVTTVDTILKQLAHEFGFDPADPGRYNNRFRNRVLSQLTAERILIIYTNAGVDGIRAEIKRRTYSKHICAA